MASTTKYVQFGTLSLAQAINCIAHSLPSRPDFVAWTPLTLTATMPVMCTSRGDSFYVLNSSNPDGVTGDIFAIFLHSIIR